MKRRVVITGVGLSTNLGDTAATWQKVTAPSPAPFPHRGEEFMNGYEQAKIFSEKAITEALNQAPLDPVQVACTFSASKPLFDGHTWQDPESMNRFVRRRFGLEGESRNVVAACATGAYSIALGASWIEQGLCDAVVAGSVEPRPHPLIEAGFRRMGVLSRESVMRPFDRRRSGFVFGEGAGAIVLEEETQAVRRGATILARLSGWAMGADAHGPVSFNSKGARIAGVITKALAKAGLSADDVSHVNAHGTATLLNDSLETQALHTAFGAQACRLAVSATKSATGHLLGAAGSVEFILTLLALQTQKVPPTRHSGEEDSACDLDYVVEKEARAWPMEHAVSVSFGFGGPIGALAVSRC